MGILDVIAMMLTTYSMIYAIEKEADRRMEVATKEYNELMATFKNI